MGVKCLTDLVTINIHQFHLSYEFLGTAFLTDAITYLDIIPSYLYI